MKSKKGVSGVGENPPFSWLALDTHNPKWITRFLLGLGYSNEIVVNTLVKRCNLSQNEATRLVEAHHQQGGSQHV